MNDAMRELYQEIILDHARHPRHTGALTETTGTAEGHNPLCGDRVKIYVKLGAEGRIEGLKFEGKGCAISQASASLMADMLQGRTKDEAERLAHAFFHMVKGEPGGAMDEDDRERLEVMAGVQQFPMRVKCATLAWHTLESALEGKGGDVNTEDEAT